ncbi:MAG: hypothetical protein V3U79_11555 [Dehalococcoidia bacterium]
MTLEAYVGEVGAREGFKLGEQMIITADGPEVISQAPLRLEVSRLRIC